MLDYGPFLYRNLGFSVVNQLLIQCGWITVCLLGNAFNAAVIDHFGRVRMLREYRDSLVYPLRLMFPSLRVHW